MNLTNCHSFTPASHLYAQAVSEAPFLLHPTDILIGIFFIIG